MLKNINEKYLNDYLKDLYVKFKIKNKEDEEKEIKENLILNLKFFVRWF